MYTHAYTYLSTTWKTVLLCQTYVIRPDLAPKITWATLHVCIYLYIYAHMYTYMHTHLHSHMYIYHGRERSLFKHVLQGGVESWDALFS